MQIQSSVSDLERDLKVTQTQLKTCRMQLNEVIGVTVRQDQIIDKCKQCIEELQSNMNKNTLCISGIKELEGEDCSTVVGKFFKEKLFIETDISVMDAYRVGKFIKSQNRVIVVILAKSRDKGLIFGNTKNLKDVLNENGKPYFMEDQLSAKKRAEKRHTRNIVCVNNNLGVQQQLNVSFQKGNLVVDGATYKKQFLPPSCRDILLASKETRMERLGKKVTQSLQRNVNGQTFIGYTTAVRDVMYAKLKSVHPDARHIMGACRIPGRPFHINQDCVDDDEHGGGEILLQALINSEIQHRAVFVVLYYDGTHIGPKHKDTILEVAKSAMDRAPENQYTG